MPRLGKITLFPRRVSIIEMKEISQQGFTFEALSSGKLAFQPQKTPLATATAMQAKYLAQAKGERKVHAQEMHMEN